MMGLQITSLHWLLVAGAAVLSSSAAQSHEFVEWPDIARCQVIEDPLTRVSCFDALFKKQTISKLELTKIDKFGRPSDAVHEKQPSRINQRILKVQRNPRQQYLLTMASDQLWRQVDTNKLSLKPRDEVVIRAGIGGSFYLQKVSGGRSLRVRRLR